MKRVISSHQNTRLSYQELHTQSTQLARGFWNQGIRKGDRVAVSLGNNIEYALATYALFKLGAILVGIHYMIGFIGYSDRKTERCP